jgi:hypothetical protein
MVSPSHPIADFLDFADRIRKDAWERYQRAGGYLPPEELVELERVATEQCIQLAKLCFFARRDVSASPNVRMLWDVIEELRLSAFELANWEQTSCGPEVATTIAFFGEVPTKEEETELFKQESLRQLRVVRWKHFSTLNARFEAAFKDARRIRGGRPPGGSGKKV